MSASLDSSSLDPGLVHQQAVGVVDGPAPHLTLLMPVYHEEENVERALDAIASSVHVEHEVVVVYDDEADPTVEIVRRIAGDDPRVRLVRNSYGRGLLNAVRTGIRESRGSAVVVTMGDVTDDLAAVDRMCELHRQGAVVVAPSRHSSGGRMLGGPRLKGALSRWGGRSLRLLTGMPTADPTNAFKLWDARFLRETPIESSGGFEYSLELCAKAFVAGHRIHEMPTVWRDRSAGTSKFRLWAWLPRYLRWYVWLVLRANQRRAASLIGRGQR